jgi:hypothetical protein
MSHDPSREVLELLLASEPAIASVPEQVDGSPGVGLLVGVLTHLEPDGEGRVAFDARSVNKPVTARTIVPLTGPDVGRQICLMFEKGDWTKPVILGFLHTRVTQGTEGVGDQKSDTKSSVEARVDGERIALEGQREIVLKCGKASITLTQDGKVLIRGAYLSSQSSGPNLIKGGSVQLN